MVDCIPVVTGLSLREVVVIHAFCVSNPLQKSRGADDFALPAGRCSPIPLCYTNCFTKTPRTLKMLLSKEYVGYLAREVSKKLIAGEFIETKSVPALTEKLNAAMLEEFGLEDRINDECESILEAYSEEMRRSGANYQEMFRKVKSELVRKYKAVL